MFYIAASDENGNSKNTIVGQIISNVKLQDLSFSLSHPNSDIDNL